jgi:NADPH:quinone reductase-like Zn-dependent oxidoreductase
MRTETMEAWQIHEFGGAEVLKLETVPAPQAGTGELLVRINATSINPVDFKTRDGDFPPVDSADLPVILGRDVAGTVVEGAGEFATGDRVYGMPAFGRGTYAEQVVMKPAEVARIADSVDMATAGSVPLAALTAWQGLFDEGQLQPGERVLILGAPGGVGHLAVQFAVVRGASVIATGRAEDMDFLKSLGADEVIDTDNSDLSVIEGEVDLVYSLLHGDAQAAAWKVVNPNGRFVSTLEKPKSNGDMPNVKTAHYMAAPDGARLAEIMELIESGEVVVSVQRTFDFDAVPDAQRALENEHSQGKIAVLVHAEA